MIMEPHGEPLTVGEYTKATLWLAIISSSSILVAGTIIAMITGDTWLLSLVIPIQILSLLMLVI